MKYCQDCGSHYVGSYVEWRPGLATVAGLISGLVSALTGVAVGANCGAAHDLHGYDYCKSCGSRNILDCNPKTPKPSTTMKSDGSGCCGCMLLVLVILIVMFLLVSHWANQNSFVYVGPTGYSTSPTQIH